MGKHTASERPSEAPQGAIERLIAHLDWLDAGPDPDVDPPYSALDREYGDDLRTILAAENDQTKALRAVRALYLVWEQEFTGKGKLHDIVQGHVTDLRHAIEDNLGEDWY